MILTTNQKMTIKYGDPMEAVFEKKWMTLYNLPAWLLPVFPANSFTGKPTTRIYMNRDLIAPFEMVMARLVHTGLIRELKTFDGCFNKRYQRGAENKKILSIHAWGMAMDFNQATNKLGGKVSFSKEFLQIWRDCGWTCGADWAMPRTDGMHFQFDKILIA